MNLYIFIFGGVWDFLTVRIMIRLSLLWRMIQGRGKKYGNKRGMPPDTTMSSLSSGDTTPQLPLLRLR